MSAVSVRPVVAWLGNVVAWLVVLALLGVVLATIAVPRFAGATPYTVLSSSMEPRLPPGTLLIVRPVATERLGVGDVITYQLRSGRPEVVSHRISAVSYGADGQVTFRTRGDHNPAEDPDPVRAAQVRGELWYAVPWVGHLTIWLGVRGRLLLTGLAVAGLTAYALVSFGSALRDRSRRRAAVSR